jgi:hypothetical protein
MQRRTAVITALALAVAACGSTQGGAKPPSTGSVSGAEASPSAAEALIVVAEDQGAFYQSAPTPVRLMRPDGKEVDRLTIKQGSRVARAAGARIFVVGDDGSLKAVHRDGSIETLGSLGSSQPSGFVVSPDGKRWMWSTFDGNSNTSQVHVAGDGLAPRVVAQMQAADKSVHAYAWTIGGAFIDHPPPSGMGGRMPFENSFGKVDRLDLAKYTTAPVQVDCEFSDMARDETVACLTGSGQNTRGIRIIRKDGTTKNIDLAMPRFAQQGDAFFSADGTKLSVAGAANVDPEQFGTDMITTKDGSIKRLAIDGIRPSNEMQGQSWLDDGSLVVFRPDGAVGGPAGVFLVGPSGKVTQLGGRGTPIGVIAAQ